MAIECNVSRVFEYCIANYASHKISVSKTSVNEMPVSILDMPTVTSSDTPLILACKLSRHEMAISLLKLGVDSICCLIKETALITLEIRLCITRATGETCI